MGFVAVFLGLAFLNWIVTRRRILLNAALTMLGLFAFAMAIHIAWRYAYFDDFISNTARLKAGLHALRIERGVNYVTTVFITVPSLLAVLLLSFYPRAMDKHLLRVHIWLILGANFVFAIQPGGDFMPMGRFLLVSIPFLTLLFAGIVRKLRGKNPMIPAGFTVAMVVLSLLPSFNLHPVTEAVRDKFNFRWVPNPVAVTEYEMWEAIKSQTETWVRVAKVLNRLTKPGESMVIGTVGAIGYYTDLYLFDTCGLVNREVALRDAPPKRKQPAHDRSVPRTFFLKHEPTYLAHFVTIEGADQLTPDDEEKWLNQPISKHHRVERHKLRPEDGLRDDGVLVLLRYIPPK